MRLVIHHHTQFFYSQPLTYAVQTLHLWPVSGACQSVEHWEIQVPSTLHAQPESEGNRVHSFTVTARPEQNLRVNRVVARGTINTTGENTFSDPPTALPPSFYLRSTALAEPHPRMAHWALQEVPSLVASRARGEPPAVSDLVALTSAVADRVQYRKGSTDVETTALEAFDWGLGVCQDQAHVMAAVCRSMGLPARYVSGYFYAANEPDLASHAWVDVCTDVAAGRWLSLDVTHRCPTDDRHVRVAAATDYSACTPIRGIRQGGGEEEMKVDLRIGTWDSEVTS